MMKHIVESSDGNGITDLESLALAILNSDREMAGLPPAASRENIPDSDGYVVNAVAVLSALQLTNLAREAFDAGFACGSSVEGWTSEQAWALSKIKRRLDNGDQHE